MGLGLGLGTGIHYQGDTLSRGAALFWDFEHMGSLDSSLTFTRGSAALAWNDSLVLASYASNVPALARAIPSGRRGLVMQGARTNLCPYSAQFDQWTLTELLAFGSGSTSNAAVAPDGTVSADLIVPNTNSGQHRADSPNAAISNSTAYTATVYAKAAGYSKVILRMRDAVSTADAAFDIDAGTVGTVTVDSWSAGSSSIESVGDGWYRLRFSATSNAAGASAGITAVRVNVAHPTSADLSAWAGDGTSGIYLWGAQLEAATFPSLYIPTTTGTAPRSADLCTHTLSAALAAALSTQGTMVVEYSYLGAGSATGGIRVYAILYSGAGGSDRHLCYNGSGSARSYVQVLTGGATEALLGSGLNVNAAVAVKAAHTWVSGRVSLRAAGGSLASDTDTPEGMPPVTTIDIGGSSLSWSLFGVIHRLWVFTESVPDASIPGLIA